MRQREKEREKERAREKKRERKREERVRKTEDMLVTSRNRGWLRNTVLLGGELSMNQ